MMKKRPVFSVFLALFALFFLASEAMAREAAERTVNFTLENGMEVVVIPDHRAPIVTQMVWYRAGSADEEAGKSGIAHFFEHLMFKGTEKHPGDTLDRAVNEVGGRSNAFTSYDYTAYFQTVPPSALARMMDFEADRMRNLILTDAVIGPERDVVLEERRLRVGGNPQQQLGEELNAVLYDNHPYGRPVLGWESEMEKLNRVDATAFYKRFYAPNNAILVVAGDIDVEAVREMAEESFGKVERGPDLPPRIRPEEPRHLTRRTLTLADARVSVPSLSKSWLVPSYRTAAPGEGEALDVLSEILGGGTLSRFYQGLVLRDHIAAQVGASYTGTALDTTSFTIYATPQQGVTLEQLEAGLDAEIVRIREEGVSEAELEAARTRLVRSMIFARDDVSGLANVYGATLATGGSVEDVDEWPQRIRAVTADQVKAAAARLDPAVSVSAYLVPPPARKPDAENPVVETPLVETPQVEEQ